MPYTAGVAIQHHKQKTMTCRCGLKWTKTEQARRHFRQEHPQDIPDYFHCCDRCGYFTIQRVNYLSHRRSTRACMLWASRFGREGYTRPNSHPGEAEQPRAPVVDENLPPPLENVEQMLTAVNELVVAPYDRFIAAGDHLQDFFAQQVHPTLSTFSAFLCGSSAGTSNS